MVVVDGARRLLIGAERDERFGAPAAGSFHFGIARSKGERERISLIERSARKSVAGFWKSTKAPDKSERVRREIFHLDRRPVGAGISSPVHFVRRTERAICVGKPRANLREANGEILP